MELQSLRLNRGQWHQGLEDAAQRRAECRALILQGLSVPQMSRIMRVKRSTVSQYVARILADAGACSRLEFLALEIERLRAKVCEQ